MELIPQVLQKAFETVKGKNLLVIVNDDPYLPVNHIMSQRVQCQCRNKIRVLSIDLAYQCLGRDQGDYHTVVIEHKAEANKPLMDVNRKRDLVVSIELCRGIEHAKVIDTTNSFEAQSRSMATYISVYSNPVLDMEWTIQNLLAKDHDCEQIMNWYTREEIPSFNMASFIGEFSAQSVVYTHAECSFRHSQKKVNCCYIFWHTYFFRGNCFKKEILHLQKPA